MASPSSFSSPSFSSPRNLVYDVFPSFSGEDVRVTFLSHFLKELDRRLVIAFKDNEIKRSQSLDPELKQAIRTSRIAVVVFSTKYAYSSWCLDELVEIVRCKEESGQVVIPIFYGLDPSHVRKQTGKFGEAFAKTCERKTEDETKLWRQSLIQVANLLGYHSQNWHNEAKMIEAVANDVLDKLNLSPSKEFEDFVGMEDHISQMSVLLDLESEEVRMVGIWGSSGIGKTTIARVLYSQLSRRFQGSVFIDKAFVSKSMELYNSSNPDDYNMKLHLLRSFLSEILDKKDIRIDRLDSVEERLKHRKVLIFIDDLDDQVVLDTLVGQTHWFGCWSRIVVITKDKHFLRAHGIDHIYEVCIPSKELALEMFCRSAFKKNSPPHGMMELATEVALLAGNLPLGLKVLGSYLRGEDKEDWMDMMSSLRDRLNGKIERTLRVSYDGLNNRKDEEIFRHIACLFNGSKLSEIKLLLADSDLDINNGLKNLVDKSLIHVRKDIAKNDIVEMHRLLEDMGKEIVRAQSSDPGEREFLVDSKDICDLLEDNNGTKKVLGIALDMDEIDVLRIHKEAFNGMSNLRFLKMYNKKWDQQKEVRWHLSGGFNYLPHKLKLLTLDGYPKKCMPSKFCPESLVKLQMRGSKLKRLWKGVHSLGGLKDIDLQGCTSLKEIPDLSMATNLEKLDLCYCSSLVELSSSIQYLNKLDTLNMSRCINLKTLPTFINLRSLSSLDLGGCKRLKIFPHISTNIQWLILGGTGIKSLEELYYFSTSTMQPLTPLVTTLPHSLTSLQNFTEHRRLGIRDCVNLETLPAGINFQYLVSLDLSGCSRLRTFPDITTNVYILNLSGTGIEEVPWWIEKFSLLHWLYMSGCNRLQSVSLHISKLKYLEVVDFSDCGSLTEASWNDSSSVEAVATDIIHSKLPVLDEASYSFPGNLINCFNFKFNLDRKLLSQPQIDYKSITLSGEEVPSYFTHRTTGTSSSLTNILLPRTSLCQPLFRFKACAMVDSKSSPHNGFFQFEIHVSCRFKGRLGNHFDSPCRPHKFGKRKGIHLVIFECCFPLNEDNAAQAELNYEHVDIEFRLSNLIDTTSKLEGWGIRLSPDFPSPE